MDTRALQKIGYGVYVVTSRKNGRFNGQIANSVIQVTSDPPTIAVSINKSNLTHQFIQASRVFAVSVICEDAPLTFIGRFGFKSGRDTDKLAETDYKVGETGAPIVLEHAVAFLEARVTQQMEVGTHTIFVGEVVNSGILTSDVCMTYQHYHQIKGGTTPKTAASYAGPETTEEKKEVTPDMVKYRCTVCGYIYDPEQGDPDSNIKPGTAFEDLPDDWECPVCGAGKDEFEKVA